MYSRSEFTIGEKVVYASHGVGQIVSIETQIIAGNKIPVYVVSFPQDKMILKVPVNRSRTSGLRSLMSKSDVDNIFAILQTKPKIGNRMWSRRAQEYESKINSGNIGYLAEVIRDLYKNIDADRSYSERLIYETALTRLASELAVLKGISTLEASTLLLNALKEKLVA
jgi:CarD family transcriptional regulator